MNTITPADYARLRRFTIAEYHAICKSGIFGDYEPTELIEGLLLRKHRPMTPRECFPQRALSSTSSILNSKSTPTRSRMRMRIAPTIAPASRCRVLDGVAVGSIAVADLLP